MARSAANYSANIDSLKVETNKKYLPGGGKTYCNIFAQDVMKLMDAELPGGTANTIAKALYGNNTPGWYSVTYSTAQNRANKGYPTIGIRQDTPSGHVVVIRPKDSAVTQVRDVLVAQAGASNFNSKTINYSWKSAVLSEVKFYTHD
ncbi:hypothetical protein D3C74_115230 [compost metagenome]